MRALLFRAVAYYLRHTAIEKGRYRLLKAARPLGRKVGHSLGSRTLRTRHGFRMELDLADWIPQDIYLTGDFEPTTAMVAERLLGPGETAVDVGANIGYFSLLFAQCVGATGRVLAFEPVPAIEAKLRRNLELNAFTHVSVSNTALSDHHGSARFYVGPEDNTGLSSLRKPRQSESSFDVSLAPFDGVVNGHNNVTLVKIDVEGAELQVLRGMEQLLRKSHPHLLVELTDKFLREMGDSAASLRAFVAQFGYLFYVIGDRCLTLIDDPRSELPDQCNALFTTHKMFGKGTTF
jgi:FkbM family methyltransferase